MAPWCGKCRMIAPFVEELAQKHPELSFAKFDTTAEPLEGLSAELGVKALPVFKFFKDGKGGPAVPQACMGPFPLACGVKQKDRLLLYCS